MSGKRNSQNGRNVRKSNSSKEMQQMSFMTWLRESGTTQVQATKEVTSAYTREKQIKKSNQRKLRKCKNSKAFRQICPTCDAQAGERCVRADGKLATRPHVQRHQAVTDSQIRKQRKSNRSKEMRQKVEQVSKVSKRRKSKQSKKFGRRCAKVERHLGRAMTAAERKCFSSKQLWSMDVVTVARVLARAVVAA